MPSFTINCPAEKWAEVKEDILRAAPNQTTGPGEAQLSDDQWIKHKILLMVKNLVVTGKRIKRQEEAEQPTDDAFTIT